MKILLLMLAGVVVIALAVVVVGSLLPRGHVVSIQAAYRAPAADVYAAINDVRGGLRWRSGLKEVEVLSSEGEPLRWRETADWGKITFVQDVNEPGRRIVSRIADADQGFGGTWTYELDNAPDGSILRITERGEVSNPLFRFMARFVVGHYRSLETYARDLGAHFGEQVTPIRL